MELAGGSILRRIRKLISKSFGDPGGEGPGTLIKPEFQHHIDGMLKDEEDRSDDESEGGEEEEDEEEGDEEEGEEEEDEDDDGDDKAIRRPSTGGKGKARRGASAMANDGDEDDEAYPAGWPHPVEDKFMKLSEMEKFLLDAEAKAAAGGDEEDEEMDEDEDEDEDGDMSDEDEEGEQSDMYH